MFGKLCNHEKKTAILDRADLNANIIVADVLGDFSKFSNKISRNAKLTKFEPTAVPEKFSLS